MPDSITSQASGKLILTGEYSILLGKTAIAFATQQATQVKISLINTPIIEVASAFSNGKSWSIDEMLEIYHHIRERHESFISGNLNIEQVMHDPSHLVLASIAQFFITHQCHPRQQGCRVEITSDIPLGSGMGSSASVIVACLKSLYLSFGIPIKNSSFLIEANAIESLQHGKTKGLDVAQSYYGDWLHMFQEKSEQIQIHPFKPRFSPALLAVHTGQPEVSTGECVQHVLKHHRSDTSVWSEFNQIALSWLQLLQTTDGYTKNTKDTKNNKTVIQLIQQNHRLLEKIGIVPEKVADFIENVEKQGGAAKISGAGAHKGNSAGMILTTGISKESLQNLCTQYRYKQLSLL